MADLDRRPGPRTPRRVREQRAYRLGLATAGLSALAVVGFVLALVGVIGGGPPILAALLAVICGLLFRRTVAG